MYLCRCACLKIYARRHFVCFAHTYSHVRRHRCRMRKAAQETKWKFCFLPVDGADHPRTPLSSREYTIVGNPICYPPTSSTRSLCAARALLLENETNFIYVLYCVCVFIVLVSLFVYTGAQSPSYIFLNPISVLFIIVNYKSVLVFILRTS